MKKIYTILGMSFLLFQAERSFAQASFQFRVTDSVVVGNPNTFDIEIDGPMILNKTAAPLDIEVVRVQNLDTSAGWLSAFCLYQCYTDAIDTGLVTIPANDSVAFIPHFYPFSHVDTQFIYMKVKNVNAPADVAYHRFYCVTQLGFGVQESAANLSKVNIYPSPIVAGNDFSMNITNVKVQSKDISLVVYNIYGGLVSTIHNLKEGNNSLNIDLAAGLYTYSLVAGNTRINAGKLSIIK